MKRGTAKKFAIAQSALAIADVLTGDLAVLILQALSRTFAHAFGIDLGLGRPRPKRIDERIARLDEARSALAEGLGALDELRADANLAKAGHAKAIASLETALADHKDAQKQLAAVKAVIAQDFDGFRQIAGVTDVRKKRWIGFGSGVLASMAASAIWSWGPALWRAVGPHLTHWG